MNKMICIIRKRGNPFTGFVKRKLTSAIQYIVARTGIDHFCLWQYILSSTEILFHRAKHFNKHIVIDLPLHAGYVNPLNFCSTLNEP